MEIETITELIHEHMYDRLNESANLPDGRNVKHNQNLIKKPKWEDSAQYNNSRKPMEFDKRKQRDNRCGQCGILNWTKQHNCPAKGAEFRKCKRKGTVRKKV